MSMDFYVFVGPYIAAESREYEEENDWLELPSLTRCDDKSEDTPVYFVLKPGDGGNEGVKYNPCFWGNELRDPDVTTAVTQFIEKTVAERALLTEKGIKHSVHWGAFAYWL